MKVEQKQTSTLIKKQVAKLKTEKYLEKVRLSVKRVQQLPIC